MAVPDRTEPAGAGGPGPAPQAPGWYPDPSRPDDFRYWNGAAWTGRHRPRPVWIGNGSGVISAAGHPRLGGSAPARPESPVRPASPSDPAAEHADPPGPAAGIERGGGGGGGSTGGGGGSSGGGPSGGSSGRDRRGGRDGARSRRMWFLISGVAVLAAVAVGVAGEAMRPKSPGPRVLTDAAFVKSANKQCDATLPGLRPQDSGPFGTAVTPAQTADQIDQAAAGLDKLADQLRIMPVSPADQPHVDGWLDGWHRYASLGRQYAVFLRQRGSANPGPLLAASVNAAKGADNFALANGLKSCTFFVVPQPDPSNEF